MVTRNLETKPACYEPAPGILGQWELCNRFLGDSRQDLCSQCQFGYENFAWRAGLVHKEPQTPAA